jgi:ABC-type cobalamin transport system permease subunit
MHGCTVLHVEHDGCAACGALVDEMVDYVVRTGSSRASIRVGVHGATVAAAPYMSVN